MHTIGMTAASSVATTSTTSRPQPVLNISEDARGRHNVSSSNSTGGNYHSPPRVRADLGVSPVGGVDPLVRAMNTVLYGLLVHFGTLWTIGGGADEVLNSLTRQTSIATNTISSSGTRVDSEDGTTGWLLPVLLLHEYWVYLQHCNVLANPFCQRLDRQYGIALLKSNQHWAIAGTLAAYWCRETVGMFLCLPFLRGPSSSWTQYLILYSLVYHTIKSRGVRLDALRRHSPSFGIMRAVIDKFYLHTMAETILTIIRLFLQGLDTWIHYCIIHDLLYHDGDNNHTYRDNTDEIDDGKSFTSSSASTRISTTKMPFLLHLLFFVWVLHAALNQYFRRSTASIMVQAWYSFTAPLQHRQTHHAELAPSSTTTFTTAISTAVDGDACPMVSDSYCPDEQDQKEKKADGMTTPTMTNNNTNALTRLQECDYSDDEGELESVSSTDTDESPRDATADLDDFIVRRLLRPGRVPKELEGRQGAATIGVDLAIRIETVVSVLAAMFLLGLGTVPFRILSTSSSKYAEFRLGSRNIVYFSEGLSSVALSFVWWLSSLLYGIWSLFLKTVEVSSSDTKERRSSQRKRIQTMINIFDLVGLIGTATCVFRPESKKNISADSGIICWYLAIGITIKSYAEASGIPRPQLFWTSLKILEFLGKLMLLRKITYSTCPHDDQLAWIEATLSLAWAIWVVSTPIPTPCEIASQRIGVVNASIAADAVFLGHPAELSDCWALWLLPYCLAERWHRPIWAIPLWPVHYIIGLYVCNYRRQLFGDKAAFYCCDDVEYDGIKMQTWTASHFGRHFLTHPLQVKRNIEAAARHAEQNGVKVLCLGALNKAESINAGGVGVVKALGPDSRLSVIHGNHLTAAAVIETTSQCFGEKARVFLTGASSKVGWAVAQVLRDRHGFEVLCHSTDPKRRAFFQEKGFLAASKLSEGTHFSNFWIVGKYDRAIPHMIPQNATAVVFSVPHSLASRPDLRVIEAGTLHMDLSRLVHPRQFTNKLCEHEIFACHAASAVAAYRLKQHGMSRILEIGPVDPNAVDAWLDDAKKLGFQVPTVPDISSTVHTNSQHSSQQELPVIIIGAGPSGLAVAASLTRRNIPSVILEAQDDPSQFGSWEHHFSGLEITSQKKWCQLPGFSVMISDGESKGEYISAKEYRNYLHLYSARFGLDIRRGTKVVAIEKGHDPQNPWTVRTCRSSSLAKEHDGFVSYTKAYSSSTVVIATGKNRIACRNTDDDLAGRLEQAKIPFCHTVDLRDESTWSLAIQAAQKGRLAIVGFGNSAADVATAILQHCPLTENTQHAAPSIHIAARTVPPIFPRKAVMLRVDTVGWWVRRLPRTLLQDFVIRFLWWVIPSSRTCNAAFPSHLPRWPRIEGRVPVIDKYGTLAAAFRSGRLVGHGPILEVWSSSTAHEESGSSVSPSRSCGDTYLAFDDSPHTKHHDSRIPIDMVLLATGYEPDDSCFDAIREDRLNGLYRCGFGTDGLLPLQTIGEEAQSIALQISSDYKCRTS